MELKAMVTPEVAATQALTWSSSDPTVAVVVGNGPMATITPLAVGDITVSVRLEDGSTASAEVHVYQPTAAYSLWVDTPGVSQTGNGWLKAYAENATGVTSLTGRVNNWGRIFGYRVPGDAQSVLIFGPGFLSRRVTGLTFVVGEMLDLGTVSLVAGEVTNDNKITLADLAQVALRLGKNQAPLHGGI